MTNPEENEKAINQRAQLAFLINFILWGIISSLIRKCNNNESIFVIISVSKGTMDVTKKVVK